MSESEKRRADKIRRLKEVLEEASERVRNRPKWLRSEETRMALAELERRVGAIERSEIEVHEDDVCVICKQLTDQFAGNPSKWPIRVCHKTCCTGCVNQLVKDELESEKDQDDPGSALTDVTSGIEVKSEGANS